MDKKTATANMNIAVAVFFVCKELNKFNYREKGTSLSMLASIQLNWRM